MLPLICPRCRAELAGAEGGRVCSGCGRHYPEAQGVLRLVERDDGFYEGAYENQVRFLPRSERAWHVWPLWLIGSGYPWTVRRFVAAGGLVVELGCAGGIVYFGRRYRMIGCDISWSSLVRLGDAYECRVQADAAACIPLPDGSADAVVSSFFWEHIPPSVKPAMLAECRRILRPGGTLVFLYDVETENPLIRRYKRRDPRRYERLFLEGDGHLGYQTPAENVALFRAAGFRVLAERGQEKTWLLAPSAFSKLAEFGGPARALGPIAARTGRAPWFYPYTALVRVADALVGPWLPGQWARTQLVVAQLAP